MITVERIEQLMKAQDDLNKVYAGEDWAIKNYDFLGYAAVETAELLNHHGGMFHYRKQEPDWPQIEMELVDILHFLLSAAVEWKVPSRLVKSWCVETAANNAIPDAGKWLMSVCLEDDLTPTSQVVKAFVVFSELVVACNFTLDHIFNKYQLKYTLNRFRIANGSVTGGYKKVWADGREDNEHLQEMAARTFNQVTGAYNLEMLTEMLQQRYSTNASDASDASDPLASLKSAGFTKQEDGTWQKVCKTADERGDAVSKVVCRSHVTASSTFVAGSGWVITAKLKERSPI